MPEHETVVSTNTGRLDAPTTSIDADRPLLLRRQSNGLPIFDISELVGTGREALISHEGDVYRLRVTSNRRLILTK